MTRTAVSLISILLVVTLAVMTGLLPASTAGVDVSASASMHPAAPTCGAGLAQSVERPCNGEAAGSSPVPGATVGSDVLTSPDEASERPTSEPRPTPSPSESGIHSAVGTVFLAGFATWYDDGPGFYAAAGPDVRRALGDWRGTTVVVCAVSSGSRCEATPVTDWCACGQRQGDPTLLDLSADLFRRLCGPLDAGLCRVTVQP